MKHSLSVLALLLLAGCSHSVPVPGGKVTTDASGQVSKIESKDGSVEIKGDHVVTKSADGTVAETNVSVSEADLGAPFYPGSAEAPGSMKITKDNKAFVSSIRTTPDEGKKVIEFYVGKLGPAKATTESTSMSMANWTKDNKELMVMTTTADGKTTISITSGAK